MILAAFALGACGDDSGADSGGTAPTGPSTEVSGSPSSSTASGSGSGTTDGDETDDPTTGDPSTGQNTPDTDPTTDTDTATSSSSGGANVTMWDLEVSVELGGEFNVTADATITITEPMFDSDVTTIMIAGGAEEHMIPLSGTVDGDTLTMTGSAFTIMVGDTTEDVSVRGTVTLGTDSLTGDGTLSSTIDGGDPMLGTWVISSATPG